MQLKTIPSYSFLIHNSKLWRIHLENISNSIDHHFMLIRVASIFISLSEVSYTQFLPYFQWQFGGHQFIWLMDIFLPIMGIDFSYIIYGYPLYLARYSAGLNPSLPISRSNSSGVTLNDAEGGNLSREVTRNILLPTLKHRSSSHLMSWVTPGSLSQTLWSSSIVTLWGWNRLS